MVRLPRSLDDVSPEWLTEVLRDRGILAAGRVEDARLEKIGTFSAELWRVHLVYSGTDSGAPASLVLKRPAPGRQYRSAESFREEVAFYRDLAVRTPVRTPGFYYGGLGETSGDALLLLEDVAGLQAFSFHRGAESDHAQLAMEQLARLHAHWWERVGSLDGFPHLGDARLRRDFAAAYDVGWASHRGLFLEVAGAAFGEIGDALVGRLAGTLEPLARPATLLHGDAHAENLPLLEEAGTRNVLLLDWQGIRRGHAAFDVGVFLAMSFPVEVRRRVEEPLVAAHADAVRAAGVAGWQDPWRDYRLAILRRAARIVEIAPGWGKGDIARAALRMVAERCAVAASDLRVGDLIA